MTWVESGRCRSKSSKRTLQYEHDGQRKRTKYTVPQVDKGTSLHCYYVKMCRTGVTCIFTCSTQFYIIAVKGCSFVYMRNCIFCPLSLSVMFIVLALRRIAEHVINSPVRYPLYHGTYTNVMPIVTRSVTTTSMVRLVIFL